MMNRQHAHQHRIEHPAHIHNPEALAAHQRAHAEFVDLAESLAAAVLDGDRSAASRLAQTLTARVRDHRKAA